MDKKYDLESIGKRLPYKIPDNLFNDMESNVMSELKRIPAENTVPKGGFGHAGKRIAIACAAFAMAASLALFLIFNSGENGGITGITDVEEAFARLDEADREYLIDIYENDLFLNE